MLHLTCNIMAQSVIVNFCHRTDNQMHIAYNAISSVVSYYSWPQRLQEISKLHTVSLTCTLVAFPTDKRFQEIAKILQRCFSGRCSGPDWWIGLKDHAHLFRMCHVTKNGAVYRSCLRRAQWFIQTPQGGYNPPAQFSCDTPQPSEVQRGLSGGCLRGCLCDRDGRGQILTWTNLFTLWNK